MTKRKYHTAHAPALVSLRSETRRPARLWRDVVFIVILGTGLAVGIVYCFRRGYVDIGAGLSAGLVFFVWRVAVYDARTLESATEREWSEPEYEERQRPVTIEQTSPSSFTWRYGKLDGTQAEYGELLDSLLDHPQRQLTVRGIPRGMLPDRENNHRQFRQELRRLGWLDDDDKLTGRGLRDLSALADGVEVDGDD